jgi:hypothetical protein
VCSTWCSILDAMLPRLAPFGSAAVMVGKLGWYQSVTEVDLTGCEEEDVSSVLAELESMPSLRSLTLPASCAERAVDAEAVCGLTTLTTLRFNEEAPEGSYRPQRRLQERHERGVARSETPHRTHRPQPLAASELCGERGGR